MVTKKIKSICLENEPILEELEEYQEQEMDPRQHTFIVPMFRGRLSSVENGSCSECELLNEQGVNYLEPIQENTAEMLEEMKNCVYCIAMSNKKSFS
jgi:hypothetical protein